MASKVDLHLHTTASDGIYTPSEITRRAAEKGLEYISITDHDTVNGVAEAQAAARELNGLTVIPGVEISTDYANGLVHILGYFVDYNSLKFQQALKEMRLSRELRAQGMIDKLAGLGIHIDWPRVKRIAGEASIGRPHIAQAMLEKGYINGIPEAFYKYIGQGGPAYVERIKTTPEEAARLILDSGGLPVLAHPLTIDRPEAMIVKLKAIGLVGIEAYYGEFNQKQINLLVKLSKKHTLIATGGSDYHGFGTEIETMLGDADVPLEAVQRLVEHYQNQKAANKELT